ncbi:MAG: D-alanine--D-alanine ligase [Minisyncoccia bacterium]
MSLTSKLKVAVLRGGPSNEYEISLKSGENVLSSLREADDYEPVDIFISKSGEWHRDGLVHEPHHALHHVDVVWNALHGSYGEDGQVQRILESLKIPFTGSSAVASALSMNKDMTKEIYKKHSLNTPAHELIYKGNLDSAKLISIFQTYLPPVIVKPASAGSSIGVRLASSFAELKDAIKEALAHSDRVIVEEYIKGREATCGVVEKLQDEPLHALAPIEIQIPLGKNFFDYDSKYSGETKEICPGKFTSRERTTIKEMSKEAHRALGLRHYSRSDFIITPKGKIYILETNSLPGLTAESLLPKALKTVGLNSRNFIDHVIKLSL